MSEEPTHPSNNETKDNVNEQPTPEVQVDETQAWKDKIENERIAKESERVVVEESKKPSNPASNLDPNKAVDAKYQMPMSNTTPMANAQHVAEILSNPDLTKEDRRKILEDRDHYICRLLQTDSTASNNLQAAFATEAMGATEDVETLRVADKDKLSKGKRSYDKELTGKAAALALTARVKGIKKVYLYNSGFHVCIRPMDFTELDNFYTEVDQEGEELGRIIGGLMFLIHDTHLKAKFADLLESIVVSTNLIGWNKKSTLINNISIQDLDTLYWAVCSMMHRNGIKLDLVCGHSECGHVTPDQLLDINRMRIVDTSQMSQEALQFLVSDEPVKEEQLKEYREKTLDLKKSFTNRNIRYDLIVPTIGDVIKYNKKLMAEVIINAGDDYSLSNQRIMRNIMLNYNRNFAPWISRVSYIDEDGNVEFSCRDIEGVHAALALSDDSEDDGELMRGVTDFIKETKLSHIGYAVLKCVKCGKSSTDAINGYRAWDAQGLFTSLTYLKLGQIGMA